MNLMLGGALLWTNPFRGRGVEIFRESLSATEPGLNSLLDGATYTVTLSFLDIADMILYLMAYTPRPG